MSRGVYWSCAAFELLLLAKAVAVAVLGKEQLWPPRGPCSGQACGDVGLLCMYVAIVAGLLGSFLEAWLGQRWVAQRRKRHEAAEAARGGPQQPLLGKGRGKEVSGAAGWAGLSLLHCEAWKPGRAAGNRLSGC